MGKVQCTVQTKIDDQNSDSVDLRISLRILLLKLIRLSERLDVRMTTQLFIYWHIWSRCGFLELSYSSFLYSI